jgi:O-antigen biosynthesis protein
VVEVSVCIPTYNGCPFLGDALESVLSQTCRDFEVLISDDGSTDDSLVLLEGFMERVSFPVRLFKNSGLGISGNCNFLANESNCNYIKFLFQDDLLEPSCIELLLKEAKLSESSGLIFSNRRVLFESLDSTYCQDIFNGCQNLSAHWNRLDSMQDGRLLLEDPKLLDSPINKIGEPSNTLILKSAFHEVGGFDPNLSQLLDLDLWFRLMSVGEVSYVNQTLSSFRIHDSQQSVANLTKGDLSNDLELLCKKLLGSKSFANLSEGFKSRALEKLMSSAERTMMPGREKVELMHKIDAFSQRMKFMESTFAWRARKCFMRGYYWIFPGRRKTKSSDNLDYYHPLAFSAYGKLVFEKHENPLCSIIIPFYGQTRLTWLCLKALELNLEKNLAVEIILVDDNSDDPTELINSLDGVRIVTNPENIGFLKSCNKAANLCRGKYLVFLNNDTQIQEGWLSPLVEILSVESNVGAVGSKLLYPDNTLQEAGGIIWRDATGCNYGKGKDHNEPQFNFVREVDYCSGASLATSRNLFLEMGGFSEHYAPAYYEDTDFCFNLRKKGHRVVYHPKSVVIHCEGASCGTSEDSGVKSYQRKNRHSFSSKWSIELANHFEPTGHFAQQYSAANRLNGSKNILVIDTYLPFHDRESGGHRLFQILMILRNLGYQVSFLPHNQKAEEPYVSELQQKGIEVLIFKQSRPGIRKQLAKRLENVDIAWICRPQMYRKYGSFIRKKCKAHIIYDTIDLHFLRIKREWELYGKKNKKLQREWEKFLREEKKFSRHCDLAITVTEDEALKVREWGNEKTFIVPNIHLSDSNSVPEFGSRSGILFIGSYLHIPNIDAAKWLVDDIMPLVWQKKPETQLFLLGSNPTSEILQLRRSGVCVTGFVEDVKPYFDQAKVFVAPLRYGAGMKGKIGQSMSLGLPVVTTSIGAEGMNLKNGKHAFINEDPEGIARNIAMLSNDEAKWNELSTAGIGHMEEYSPEVVSVKINEIVLGSL